jgi:hypothetical protein
VGSCAKAHAPSTAKAPTIVSVFIIALAQQMKIRETTGKNNAIVLDKLSALLLDHHRSTVKSLTRWRYIRAVEKVFCRHETCLGVG